MSPLATLSEHPLAVAPRQRDELVEETQQTVCYSVHGRSDVNVMTRVLELFAKLGVVPDRWHSATDGRQADRLQIDLQVRGLTRVQREHIAQCMRGLVDVDTVLMSLKSRL